MKAVRLTAISAMTGLMLASSASAANLVGYWNFNNPNNPEQAAVGQDLTLNGSDAVAPVNLGGSDGARQIGVAADNGNSYTVQNLVGANGGGNFTNNWTFLWDVYLPSSDTNGYVSLLQTNLNNANDGDLFIQRQKGNIIGALAGLGGYSSTEMQDDTWSRIVMSVSAGNFINLYLDGTRIYSATTLGSGQQGALDGTYGLQDHFQIFQDGGGGTPDTDTIDVTNLAYWNGALTDQEVAALGDAHTAIMPVPEPASLALLGLGGLTLISRRRGRAKQA